MLWVLCFTQTLPDCLLFWSVCYAHTMGLYTEDVLAFHFQLLQASVLADADQCLFQVQPKKDRFQLYRLLHWLSHYYTTRHWKTFLILCYIVCLCRLKTVVINCKLLHGPESFWKVNSQSSTQDNGHLSCNSKVYYHVHTTVLHPEPDESSLHPHTVFH